MKSFRYHMNLVNLMDFFLTTFIELENNMNKNVKSNASLKEMKDKKLRNKYIIFNIMKEILKIYQVHILVNKKLIYNDINILNFIYSIKVIKKVLYLLVLSTFTILNV